MFLFQQLKLLQKSCHDVAFMRPEVAFDLPNLKDLFSDSLCQSDGGDPKSGDRVKL